MMYIVRNHYFSTLILGVLWLLQVGAAQAQVAVTSADPSSAPQGTISLDVTVNGNGFDNSAAVSFLVTGTTNPGGITVKKVVVRGSKKLVATIEIADTAVVSNFDIQVELSDGRKGKGTSLFAVLAKTNDPCAVAGLDFPTFAFHRPSGQTAEILVADATGTCVRSVLRIGIFGANTLQFSYPVSGTANRGRIAWNESESGPTVVGIDFTVDATTRQLTVFPKTTIHAGTGGYITLSRDGNSLYTITYPVPEETVIFKYALSPTGTPIGSPETVFQAPAGAIVGSISVNGADSVIFADWHPAPGPPTAPRQLVWIPLDASNSYYVIASHAEQVEFLPAAHPTSDLVVHQNPMVAGSCDPLVIREIGGATVPYPLQPAFGVMPTWMNGKVLADGRVWVRNRGCRHSGTIMQLDPATGVQTALIDGYAPDGR